MEIRRAKPKDAAILTEIAFAAKRHWGYPEQWIQRWTSVLTVQAEFIAKNETYIAYAGGQAVGFYGLVSRAGKMSLEHFWVVPNAMRQGIGRLLFSHAVQRAKTMGFCAIEIESDPNAEKFYERMGARRVGGNVTEVEAKQRILPVLIYDCR
jgi:GNAT superfamily N-acetyltransferase